MSGDEQYRRGLRFANEESFLERECKEPGFLTKRGLIT